MNFVQATNTLIQGITLEDVAKEIGVSHGLLRLSRLNPSNASYRKPPAEWEAAVVRLADRRAAELGKLKDRLGKQASSGAKRAGRKRAAKKGGAKRTSRKTAKRSRR